MVEFMNKITDGFYLLFWLWLQGFARAISLRNSLYHYAHCGTNTLW